MGAKTVIENKFLEQCRKQFPALPVHALDRTKRGALFAFKVPEKKRPIEFEIHWKELLDLVSSEAALADFLKRELPQRRAGDDDDLDAQPRWDEKLDEAGRPPRFKAEISD